MNTKKEFLDLGKQPIANGFLNKDDFVIEVASNDGILLDFLRSKVNVLGIDAAPNAVLKALKLGIPTFPSLFNLNVAQMVEHEFGKAKLVMANNCIAHVDDLTDFMNGIDKLLS